MSRDKRNPLDTLLDLCCDLAPGVSQGAAVVAGASAVAGVVPALPLMLAISAAVFPNAVKRLRGYELESGKSGSRGLAQIEPLIKRLSTVCGETDQHTAQCLMDLLLSNEAVLAESLSGGIRDELRDQLRLSPEYTESESLAAVELLSTRVSKIQENGEWVELLAVVTRSEQSLGDNQLRLGMLLKDVDRVYRRLVSMGGQIDELMLRTETGNNVDPSDALLISRFLDWQAARNRIDPYLKSSGARDQPLSALYQPLRVDHFRIANAYAEEHGHSALVKLIEHPRVVLLGDAGSGKSSFSRYLIDRLSSGAAEQILPNDLAKEQTRFRGHGVSEGAATARDTAQKQQREQLAAFARRGYIPLFLPLHLFVKGLPTNLKGTQWTDLFKIFLSSVGMPERLHRHHAQLADALFESGDRLLLLFDGLDEVNDASAVDESQRHAFLRWLDDPGSGLNTLHQDARVLIASRPYAWDGESMLQRCSMKVMQLWPLREDQRADYARVALPLMKGGETLDVEPLARAVQEERVGDLCASPLLLAMVVRSYVSTGGRVPRLRAELYGHTLQTLLQEWPVDRRLMPEQSLGGESGDTAGFETRYLPLIEGLCKDHERELPRLQSYLRALAFEVQDNTSDRQSAVAVPRDKLAYLCSVLERDLIEKNDVPAKLPRGLLMQYLRAHAGLLYDRTPHQFQFVHQSHKDYLVARYLIDATTSELWDHSSAFTGEQDSALVARLQDKPEHWREAWGLMLQLLVREDDIERAVALVIASTQGRKQSSVHELSVVADALDELYL